MTVLGQKTSKNQLEKFHLQKRFYFTADCATVMSKACRDSPENNWCGVFPELSCCLNRKPSNNGPIDCHGMKQCPADTHTCLILAFDDVAHARKLRHCQAFFSAFGQTLDLPRHPKTRFFTQKTRFQKEKTRFLVKFSTNLAFLQQKIAISHKISPKSSI